MTLIHGFELTKDQYIQEIHSQARVWKHAKTGARLLSLVNDDRNKVFACSFRTPPPDSTGVAHILEHSVLCGSQKYPLKEPFVELLKGSLKTFLNAFTYPDKTCYPVASTNLADFYNLMDVYLDAVFFPRLGEHIFQQEGWRIEPGESPGTYSFQGVVLNEMKGVYSSPDSVMEEEIQRSLFPDTSYAQDSGGAPEHILDLTNDQFEDFHRRYYHPSNAWIFFHGNDPEEDRLKKVATYLDQFDRLEIDSHVMTQPTFIAPRAYTATYAAEKVEENTSTPERRSMFTVNWMLPAPTDAQDKLLCEILEYLLVGMPASPLRKALIDSNLGEDLAGVELENELRQMYFSTGLKGISPDKAGEVESLIFSTLKNIVRDGLPDDILEAAINSIEFDLRECNTGRTPRGLSLMLLALTSWLYDGDPLAHLAFETPLQAIKVRLKNNEPVFEELIQTYFLDNSHRSTVLMNPDTTLQQQRQDAEQKRLDTALQQLSEQELAQLHETARELKKIQSTPDTPEALGTIPRLKLKDLDKKNTPYPLQERTLANSTLLYHNIETSGIAYVDLAFDYAPLYDICPQLIQLTPLFSRALLEMGTNKRNFSELSIDIASKTGGIDPEIYNAPILDTREAVARVILRGKATMDNTDDLLAIFHEILLETNFDNQSRFLQMVLEEKADEEAHVVPSGHITTYTRVLCRSSKSGRLKELTDGATQLYFLRKLAKEVETNWSVVKNALECLRDYMLTQSSLVLNVTMEETSFAKLEPKLENFVSLLPQEPKPFNYKTIPGATPGGPLDELDLAGLMPPQREGLSIPAPINFVGKGTNVFDLGYEYHASAIVVTKSIRNGWLWEQVRVKGGAYGAFCFFERASGVLAFASYRDPNIAKTLDAYDQTAKHLRASPPSQDELVKSIIGAISDLDPHHLPDAQGYQSMTRWLVGDTDARRQTLRDQVLATTSQDFVRFADAIDLVATHGGITVLGNREELEKVAQSQEWNITKLL